MKSINPYLTFWGNCEEAFNHYKSVFGGEFSYIGRFKDMPAKEGKKLDEAEANLIMHVSLPMGDSVLMGSDTTDKYAGPKAEGNNFSISINVDSKEEADKIFKGLTDGGNVIMPLGETFWAAYFGMAKDKFGIHWMLNFDFK